MRTTIDINDDLMLELKNRSFTSGDSLKKVINRIIRLGLNTAKQSSPQKYVLPEFSMGTPQYYSLDRSLGLADELETEELIRKISLRK
ncbi:MAG: hypothetical protein JW841_03355 [Deltaproteobacteria bacterium]|nr:hypothetical protein [Deltaproteobacteria bacterium]